MSDEKEFELQLISKERQIVKVHALYLAIIFIIISAFLLLIAPITISPRAFENFSFASIVVSIVLAVVSIVYSFKAKSNSSENIAGIREIERNIDLKLEKFESLKVEIIEEVKGITRPIETEVSNIRLGQVEANNQMKQMFEKMTQPTKELSSNNDGEILMTSASFYGNLLMYILSMSHSTGKLIDFSKIASDLNDNYDYLWGFWVAVSALKERPFKYEVSGRTVSVNEYDEAKLGGASYWRSIIEAYKDKLESRKYLDAIDSYFSSEHLSSDTQQGLEAQEGVVASE